MMRLGMMLIRETKFRIGNAIRGRSNVRADSRGVCLESQHSQVAHDLHILTSFVTLRNADFNGNWIKENLLAILLSNPSFRGGVTRRAAEKIGEVALELIKVTPK